MTHTLKFINDERGRIGGYLLVWGTPHQRDLQGEYFTPETDLALDWYAVRPVLYQHGQDDALKTAVVGQIIDLRADEVGIWAEAQLHLRHHYVQAVQHLIEQGALAWSSGSLPHLVEREADGRIKRWPLVEGSLTPTPAEPRYTHVATVQAAYKTLGLDFSRLAQPTPSSNLPTHTGQPTMEQQPTLKRLPHTTQDTAPRVRVSSPYDDLTATDLLHGYLLLSHTKHFKGVSESYSNALAHKLTTERLTAIKSDELSYSTQVGFGDEWVADLWSAQVWSRARLDNVILPLFPSIEMPSNPFELPAESTDPTVYYVGETRDEAQLTLGATNPIPDSKIGTNVVRLEAKKLALRVGFSAELVEDAVLPVLSLYREQAMRALSDSIDHVLLNGDSATTGNINRDGATPATNERFMAFDGLRKTALTNAINANAPLSLANLRQARFALPMRYAARPQDLAWIVDGSVYASLLGLSEFVTMDKAGPHATAFTGQIGNVDGASVLVSAEMPDKTTALGKVSSTVVNNTRGSAICVYRPGWYVGYRRRVSVDLTYLPYTDSYQLTATVRLAFNRNEATVASALINLG